jgi:hypothetical protein
MRRARKFPFSYRGDVSERKLHAMKIATWNLESSNPLTPTCRTAFLDAMLSMDADVWVLTETWTDFSLEPDFLRVAQSDPAQDLTPERRWVDIWVKTPLTGTSATPQAQSDRMACARLTQSGQRDIVIIGTVLPWPNDPRWPGAKGFCNALDAQAREWKRLRGKPDTAALVVAGDFNQSIPYQRYYGSKDGATDLKKLLDGLGLDCVTQGDDPGTHRPRIDHICVSHNSPVGTWTVPLVGSKPITDHAGVFASLDQG